MNPLKQLQETLKKTKLETKINPFSDDGETVKGHEGEKQLTPAPGSLWDRIMDKAAATEGKAAKLDNQIAGWIAYIYPNAAYLYSDDTETMDLVLKKSEDGWVAEESMDGKLTGKVSDQQVLAWANSYFSAILADLKDQ